MGGPADFFVTPKNYEELSWVLKCCAKYEMPCYIMGNGSNLLVSDQGYRGVVIQLFRQLNDIQCEGNVLSLIHIYVSHSKERFGKNHVKMYS